MDHVSLVFPKLSPHRYRLAFSANFQVIRLSFDEAVRAQ
jgi:hypothetical protein